MDGIEVLSRTQKIIVQSNKSIRVVNAGPPGPRGPQGTVGDFASIALTILSGNRVVVLLEDGVEYASNQTSQHSQSAMGVTTASALEGQPVEVRMNGVMTDSAWTWNPETALYLGANGLLTPIVPTSGFLRQIAWAITPTKIFIDPREPINL